MVVGIILETRNPKLEITLYRLPPAAYSLSAYFLVGAAALADGLVVGGVDALPNN